MTIPCNPDLDPNDLINAFRSIDDRIVASITDTLLPQVFSTVESLEHEMSYKAKQFAILTEVHLTTLMITNLLKVVEKLSLAVPDILSLPLDLIPEIQVSDIFGLVGNLKMKNAILSVSSEIALILGLPFNSGGEIDAPDYAAEEVYLHLMENVMQVTTGWIFDVLGLVWDYLKQVPVIGNTISSIGRISDPSASLLAALADGATDLLTFPLPFFGSLADYMRLEVGDIEMAEHVKSDLRHMFAILIEKIAKISLGEWVTKVYDLLLRKFDKVKDEVSGRVERILKTIMAAFEIMVEIFTGRYNTCTAAEILIPGVLSI